jgi:hypothetical protein
MQSDTTNDDQLTNASHPTHATIVRVEMTRHGERARALLSALHRDELRRMGTALAVPEWSDAAGGAA